MPPIEAILAPLEAELKLARQEIAKLQDDNKALDRLTKSKEAALIEAEKTVQVGMAAALASVCSVPLTSVLLLFELTNDYRILLSLMNLAESIDCAGLEDMFKKNGNILSSKVVMFDEGKSKGYGFVQFETEESANAAIEKLNGSAIDDKQM